MRFVISGEWTKNSLLKLIIWYFLLFSLLLCVTNFLIFSLRMGFTPTAITEYYLGSEVKYTQARSYAGLLEVSHFHMFAMGMFILTLSHLLLFVPLSLRLKAILINLSFLSALGDELSAWLIRFVSPAFSYLKLLSFCSLHVCLLTIISLLAFALYRERPSAYTASDPRYAPKNQ